MPRKSTSVKETSTDAGSLKHDNKELRAVLFDLLDYMGGSDLAGLQADHPLAKAWALRAKLDRR